jgi:predicted PurR-regulated permease PerM
LKTSYTQIVRYLQITVFSAVILYFGKALFIPIFFSLLVSFSIYPFCKWLEAKRLGRGLAIGLALGLVTVIFGCLIWLFLWELHLFWLDVPALARKLETTLPDLQRWIEKNFGLTSAEQRTWIGETTSGSNLSGVLRSTFNATVSTAFYLFLVPVFSALFLYHRRTFVFYLRMVINPDYHEQLSVILIQTTSTYSRFIKGMAIVYLVVGILNSIGLLALGIKHAVLFGMLTAIMTIIPYIGILVSALLPISVAWLTTDSLWYPLGVIAVFSFVQYLEANVIFPMVVGTQLNVSTWATLVAVIAGGIIWGVSGMILFIPFLAILKIISDNVEGWKPLNLLLSRSAD